MDMEIKECLYLFSLRWGIEPLLEMRSCHSERSTWKGSNMFLCTFFQEDCPQRRGLLSEVFALNGKQTVLGMVMSTLPILFYCLVVDSWPGTVNRDSVRMK